MTTANGRFDARVRVEPAGCHTWTGSRNPDGYGHFWVPGKRTKVPAHRWAYERARGPIPAGLEIDHLCRNRDCVNPDHLEAVTHRENLLRGNAVSGVNARKTHCPQGHPYDETNTRREKDGSRKCRACDNAGRRARWAALRALREDEAGGLGLAVSSSLSSGQDAA